MSFAHLRLITKADAAEIFRVSTKTIDNYIRDGRLPPPIQFASKEFWHPKDFQSFLDATFRQKSDSKDRLEPWTAGNLATKQSYEGKSPSRRKQMLVELQSNK